jgi:hypothetical protein
VSNEKEILRKEYARLITRLEEVDPVQSPALYKELLEAIDSLYNLSGLYYEDSKEWYGDFKINPGVEIPVTTEPSAEEFRPPVMEPEEPEVEEPKVEEPEEPKTEEPKTYKREDVRAALARARKKGVSVAELLSEFGVDNFTGLPAAKYGELMSKLGES